MSTPFDLLANPSRPRRLAYLDGIRGVASLFVVIHHAGAEVSHAGVDLGLIRLLLGQGTIAVPVFVVLSGYLMSWPMSASREPRIRGGFWAYLGRRLRRIYPPYGAMLLIIVAASYVFPACAQYSGSRWDEALPIKSPGSLSSHVLMLHNFDRSWKYTIDPPMWSIAVEWQAYLLFPLLVAIWRKFGVIHATLIGSALGYVPVVIARMTGRVSLGWAETWLWTGFSLGMAAASFGRFPGTTRIRGLALMASFSLLISYVFALIFWPERWGTIYHHRQIFDPLACLGMALALWSISSAEIERSSDLARDLGKTLSRPWLVSLGAMSYSLYLSHYPVLSLVDCAARRLGLDALGRSWMQFGVGVPASLLVGYAFHVAVERRFLADRGPRLAGDPPAA